eukprot:tig00020830_g14430.t1
MPGDADRPEAHEVAANLGRLRTLLQLVGDREAKKRRLVQLTSELVAREIAEGTQPSPLLQLPAELFDAVVSLLDAVSARSLSQTCRSARSAVARTASSAWREVACGGDLAADPCVTRSLGADPSRCHERVFAHGSLLGLFHRGVDEDGRAATRLDEVALLDLGAPRSNLFLSPASTSKERQARSGRRDLALVGGESASGRAQTCMLPLAALLSAAAEGEAPTLPAWSPTPHSASFSRALSACSCGRAGVVLSSRSMGTPGPSGAAEFLFATTVLRAPSGEVHSYYEQLPGPAAGRPSPLLLASLLLPAAGATDLGSIAAGEEAWRLLLVLPDEALELAGGLQELVPGWRAVRWRAARALPRPRPPRGPPRRRPAATPPPLPPPSRPRHPPPAAPPRPRADGRGRGGTPSPAGAGRKRRREAAPLFPRALQAALALQPPAEPHAPVPLLLLGPVPFQYSLGGESAPAPAQCRLAPPPAPAGVDAASWGRSEPRSPERDAAPSGGRRPLLVPLGGAGGAPLAAQLRPWDIARLAVLQLPQGA